MLDKRNRVRANYYSWEQKSRSSAQTTLPGSCMSSGWRAPPGQHWQEEPCCCSSRSQKIVYRQDWICGWTGWEAWDACVVELSSFRAHIYIHMSEGCCAVTIMLMHAKFCTCSSHCLGGWPPFNDLGLSRLSRQWSPYIVSILNTNIFLQNLVPKNWKETKVGVA